MTPHNHTQADDKIMKEVDFISRELKKSETLKIQSQTQLTTMRAQYAKGEDEIREMGVDPKKAEEALAVMDEDIAKLMAEIKVLIPTMQAE